MNELDSFDISILKILQSDNYTPQKDIGAEIGLSAPAVQRRIKRLTSIGLIRKNVALLDQGKLGNLITIIVEVGMERDKLVDVEEAKSNFRNSPAVQQCYYVTGNADFMLVIIVPNMHEYELLTHQLFFSNPNIKHFKTYVTMDLVKTSTEIPF